MKCVEIRQYGTDVQMLAAAGTEQATNYITLHDSNTMLSDGG